MPPFQKLKRDFNKHYKGCQVLSASQVFLNIPISPFTRLSNFVIFYNGELKL